MSNKLFIDLDSIVIGDLSALLKRPYRTKDEQRRMFAWEYGLGKGLTMQERRRWRRRNRRRKET